MPFVQADIGPSPPNCFEITNTGAYSDYEFFYRGEIMKDWIVLGSGEQCLYKLEPGFYLAALPKSKITPNMSSGEKIGVVENEGIKSEMIVKELGWMAIYQIKDIDAANNTLTVEEMAGIIDNGYNSDSPLIFILLIGSAVVFIVIVVAVIAVVAFLFLKGKKK